jgi:NAD-dependent dihydropyrimidine dehydrogenase PreA subunit
MGTDHVHRVCTYKEAEASIRAQDVIYVNDCFCRTPAKEDKTSFVYCGHPTENCMGFYRPDEKEHPYPFKEISQEAALKLFEDWKDQGNFFRFMEDEKWVCFCCSCGCLWFRDKEGNRVKDPCDKSAYIERTDANQCVPCGLCVDACAWGARALKDDEMVVEPSLCYGCSACESCCPNEAISMAPREK